MKEQTLAELKKTYVVYLMDTDCDTGFVSQMQPIAYTDSESYAVVIADMLNSGDEDSPNREYKVTKL